MLLLSLFCELLDPSTNFIRVSPNTISEQGLDLKLSSLHASFSAESDETTSGKSQDNGSGNSVGYSDVSVHCCFPVTFFDWHFDLFYQTFYLDKYKILIDQYEASIFQPPKIIS